MPQTGVQKKGGVKTRLKNAVFRFVLGVSKSVSKPSVAVAQLPIVGLIDNRGE